MVASISKSIYGKTSEGQEVHLFTLENAGGMIAKIINYGATLTELYVPDKNGKLEDIVLGFDDLEGYMKNDPYFGCTVGRVAIIDCQLIGFTIQRKFPIGNTIGNATRSAAGCSAAIR